MCNPNRGLHNNVEEIETDSTLKQLIKSVTVSDAEWFFLQNEDVLN